jgi:LysR family glycine cleavage system transcriptional activator
VQIELRCDVSTAALSSGEVDVMLQAEPGASPGLASRPLVQQQLFAVAGPTFRGDAEAHALPAAALIESLECPWSLWFGRLGRRGPAGPPAITVDNEGAAIEMAKAGVGVCLARSALVQDALRTGSLVRVGSAETPAGALHFVWSVSTAKGALAQTFMSWLSDDLAVAGAAAYAPRNVGATSSFVPGMLLAAAPVG